MGDRKMIKILIVLEEEDGVDFRAYALQISDWSKDLPPQVKLHLVESKEDSGADNVIPRPSALIQPELEDHSRSLMHQIRRPLQTRQIFMN